MGKAKKMIKIIKMLEKLSVDVRKKN